MNVAGVVLNFNFTHNLMRSQTTYNDPFYTNIIWNENPLFENTAQGDFIYLNASPLNGAGINTGLLSDIFGIARSNPPDIGAVEIP